MIGLDTNVLVRYFTHDDTRQSPLAVRLIERQLDARQPGHVSLVGLAELVWVLRTRYDATEETVAEIVAHLLADDRFVVHEASVVSAALDGYRHAAVDFGDALIAALDRTQGCRHTVTFDRGAARIEGMTLLE
ncbi:MAG TPA: VapC toxin family PIN domain ribonuclease [Rhodocyclaceae bacterium]|nr:VapC toxin family PIN domain ribonuclease [Rhodocyclaceae bacterium]